MFYLLFIQIHPFFPIENVRKRERMYLSTQTMVEKCIKGML